MNARDISPALQNHLNTGITTVTLLIKVVPRDPSYPPFGITKLDRDIVYDDGDGDITYSALVGMVPANLSSTAAMDVGNSQFQHLIPEFSIPIDEQLIRAGVYDYAEYTVYLVNYEDLTMGHWIPPAGHGQTGQMTIDNRGLSFVMEMTDDTKQLKQTIVEKDSITCRAIFGSQPIGSSDSNDTFVEQRFPCGKDLSSLWTSGDVTSVGLENTLNFTDSGLGLAEGAAVPGMVQWITGSNAGRQYEVSSQTAAGVIELQFEAMFPIQVGDTFRIRPDCTKWIDGTNGCKFHFGEPEWKNHYRGEPFIPISDADQINTPGATVGTGSA